MAPKRGRPTDYSPKFPDWVRALARRGLSEMEIAKEMGIARSTLKKWQKEHPEFLDAVRHGKGEADALVESALFKRATGYDVEETRVIGTPERNPKADPKDPRTWYINKTTRVEKTTKHVTPDLGAISLWLKNRRPDLWRDVQKVEQEITGKDGAPLQMPVINVCFTRREDEESGGD